MSLFRKELYIIVLYSYIFLQVEMRRTEVSRDTTFVVSIRSLSLRKHLFTGSILSESTVLTTCHNLVSFSWSGKPIDNFNRSDYRVYTVGEQFGVNRQVAGVQSITVHKHCNSDQSGINFDLGIIKLLNPFLLTEGINVTPLLQYNTKSHNENFKELISSNAKFTLLTWNVNEAENEGEVSHLIGFIVVVEKWGHCSELFCGRFCEERNSIDKICAKHDDESCPGDSGAPLTFKNITWAIASVTHYRCPKGYEIYTRVDSSIAWIQRQLYSTASEKMRCPFILFMIVLNSI